MIFKKQYKVELAPTLEKHWYLVSVLKKNNKWKSLGYFPSFTTVLNAYPFSEQLVKWIADKGYNEARESRNEAGKSGTKIHSAIEELLKGDEVRRDIYSLEEWNKICSFVSWYQDYKPTILALETPIFSRKLGIPGRIDCIAQIDGKNYVLDWKSSRSIHPSYYLQIAGYAFAVEESIDIEIHNTAILQLGTKAKKGYTFSVDAGWRDNVDVLRSVYTVWNYDNRKESSDKVEAPILILPDKIKLDL